MGALVVRGVVRHQAYEQLHPVPCRRRSSRPGLVRSHSSTHRAAIQAVAPSDEYYSHSPGSPGSPEIPPIFVRADTTYLKQDFSVMQGSSRFDYVVHTRPARSQDQPSLALWRPRPTESHKPCYSGGTENSPARSRGPTGKSWPLSLRER